MGQNIIAITELADAKKSHNSRCLSLSWRSPISSNPQHERRSAQPQRNRRREIEELLPYDLLYQRGIRSAFRTSLRRGAEIVAAGRAQARSVGAMTVPRQSQTQRRSRAAEKHNNPAGRDALNISAGGQSTAEPQP